MEAIRSSETSVLIRATRRHLPEDDNHHCRVKTYQDAANSLNNVISQAKVFVESQAAKRVNCVQKTPLEFW
jgi:hypothetical protein